MADRNHLVVVVVAPLGAAIADRRPETHGPGQRRGHAGRTAGVRSEAAGRDPRSDRRRRSARRAARDPVGVVGIAHRSGEGCEIGAGDAEGELVQIGLADDDGAGVEQLLQRRCVARRPRMLQRRCAARRRQVRRVDVVLHDDRKPGQHAGALPRIDLARRGQCAVAVQHDEGVEMLEPLRAIERRLDDADCGHLAAAYMGHDLRSGCLTGIGHGNPAPSWIAGERLFFRPLVVNPFRLAERTLQRLGRDDADAGGNADRVLDEGRYL
ncbi:hypothetical protein chiPu_0029789, partial [Chiloscyllium punctatum]|nr:hypothetical protein [Chiloscyllium punctatum]